MIHYCTYSIFNTLSPDSLDLLKCKKVITIYLVDTYVHLDQILMMMLLKMLLGHHLTLLKNHQLVENIRCQLCTYFLQQLE
jgi:hypothetical protein